MLNVRGNIPAPGLNDSVNFEDFFFENTDEWGFSGINMATMKAIITNIAPKANGGPGTTSCKTENYFYLIICHRFWNIKVYM